jgi:hypothetical protein
VGREGGKWRVVAQTMYTHVSKCKTNKIKERKIYKKIKTHSERIYYRYLRKWYQVCIFFLFKAYSSMDDAILGS